MKQIITMKTKLEKNIRRLLSRYFSVELPPGTVWPKEIVERWRHQRSHYASIEGIPSANVGKPLVPIVGQSKPEAFRRLRNCLIQIIVLFWNAKEIIWVKLKCCWKLLQVFNLHTWYAVKWRIWVFYQSGNVSWFAKQIVGKQFEKTIKLIEDKCK